jgi:hypothetical protein
MQLSQLKCGAPGATVSPYGEFDCCAAPNMSISLAVRSIVIEHMAFT